MNMFINKGLLVKTLVLASPKIGLVETHDN